jgi:hypothetical protein
MQSLFEKADMITDALKSDKALGDLEQKIIVDFAGIVPMYIEASTFMTGSKLGGVQADGGYGTLSPLAAFVRK